MRPKIEPRERYQPLKECNQCGKCCTKYGDGGLSVSASEIEQWDIFRPDIYQYVSAGKIWISPVTAKPMQRCPWLRKLPNQRKYICRIYFDRPDDCKHYPVSIADMVKDDCEMIEVKDLKNPKQAQKNLDKLMIDSRPPFIS
jgi:Fe-S-cluster containining protein